MATELEKLERGLKVETAVLFSVLDLLLALSLLVLLASWLLNPLEWAAWSIHWGAGPCIAFAGLLLLRIALRIYCNRKLLPTPGPLDRPAFRFLGFSLMGLGLFLFIGEGLLAATGFDRHPAHYLSEESAEGNKSSDKLSIVRQIINHPVNRAYPSSEAAT